jgi:hypothetical protein
MNTDERGKAGQADVLDGISHGATNGRGFVPLPQSEIRNLQSEIRCRPFRRSGRFC